MEHSEVHEEVRTVPAVDDYVFNERKIGIVTAVDVDADIIWVEYVAMPLSKFLRARKPVPGPTDDTICWMGNIKKKHKGHTR